MAKVEKHENCGLTSGTQQSALVAGPQSKIRILVVDDCRDFADTLTWLIAQEDRYEVKQAYEGAAALALSETFSPHVALVDLEMPKMNGYQLAELLRGQCSTRGVRILALSGYAGSAAQHAQSHLFDGWLLKPVTAPELFQAMDTVLREFSGHPCLRPPARKVALRGHPDPGHAALP